MFDSNKEEIKELREKISKLEERQYDFLEMAHKVLQNVTNQSKKKFMYDILQEDIELMEEGRKMRAIRKIIE